jgi:hypothetical protein
MLARAGTRLVIVAGAAPSASDADVILEVQAAVAPIDPVEFVDETAVASLLADDQTLEGEPPALAEDLSAVDPESRRQLVVVHPPAGLSQSGNDVHDRLIVAARPDT